MTQPAATEHPRTAAEFFERQKRTRQRLADVQRKVQAARADLAEAGASRSSADRAVTLTVNPGGMLTHLTFGPGADRKPLAQLADTVLQTYWAACREAVQHTVGVMSEFVNGDEQMLAALRANLPAELADDPEEDER